jgi:hypothetical protein
MVEGPGSTCHPAQAHLVQPPSQSRAEFIHSIQTLFEVRVLPRSLHDPNPEARTLINDAPLYDRNTPYVRVGGRQSMRFFNVTPGFQIAPALRSIVSYYGQAQRATSTLRRSMAATRSCWFSPMYSRIASLVPIPGGLFAFCYLCFWNAKNSAAMVLGPSDRRTLRTRCEACARRRIKVRNLFYNLP